MKALIHKHRTAHSSNDSHMAGCALALMEAELALSYLRSGRVVFSFSFPGIYIIFPNPF